MPCAGLQAPTGRRCPCLQAEEGLERVLTLWLLQCVTVAWFSEKRREESSVSTALQPLGCCTQGGHAELASKPWSHVPHALLFAGGPRLSPSPPPPWAPLCTLGDTSWLHPPTLGHREAGTLRVLLLAVPAGCLLGTGALAALLVADILVYLVDSPVPAHTAQGQAVRELTGTDLLLWVQGESLGVSPVSFQTVVDGLGRNGAEPAMPKGLLVTLSQEGWGGQGQSRGPRALALQQDWLQPSTCR